MHLLCAMVLHKEPLILLFWGSSSALLALPLAKYPHCKPLACMHAGSIPSHTVCVSIGTHGTALPTPSSSMAREQRKSASINRNTLICQKHIQLRHPVVV